MSAVAHIAPVAAPEYANDPAKLAKCNAWVEHARPIILAMLMLDDEVDSVLLRAKIDADKDRRWNEPVSWQARDYDEARGEVKGASKALFAMLDGIRDNFICDEMVGVYDNPDAQEEADAFNDWLHAETIGVDAAVNRVAEDQV